MTKTPFLSKEVRLKRVGLLLCLIVLLPILLFTIGSYYYNILDTSLRNHYLSSDCSKTKEPLVLGEASIDLIDKFDSAYSEGADVYINGEWKTEEYIPIERMIDNPEYSVKAGSITKDIFDIGNGDKLYLECGKIDEQSLEFPPYWSSCTLKINDYYTFSTDIRSDIYCEDYGDYDDPNIHPSGCKEEVGIVFYSDPNLNHKYLFLSSGDWIGSPYAFSAYQIGKDSVSKLYFDFRTFIDEEKMVRGGLDSYNLNLAFTDSTKKDFKLVVYFYDPSMQKIKGIYDEFIVTKGRFLLDKKIVSQ